MKTALIVLLFTFGVLLITNISTTRYPSYTYQNDASLLEQPENFWKLANFDGVHYLDLARLGYQAKFQTAFFPLYPTLIFILSFFTHNFLISGFLISYASLSLSVYLICKLSGFKSLLSLVFFPTSFFLISIYSDSLFLVLGLLSYYFYQKNKMLSCAAIIALATASRFYGAFLIPFFLHLAHTDNKHFNLREILLMPSGLLLYMGFLAMNFSDPIAFFHALSSWQKSNLVLPIQTVYRYLKILITVSPTTTQYYVSLLELVIFSFIIYLNLLLLKAKKYSQAIYLFLGWLVPSMTGTLQSFPRYALALFPIYPLIAKSKYFPGYLLLGGVSQIILIYAFSTGLFVS